MNWKHVERRVAELVGGKRIPVTGRHEHSADIEHHALAIEVKSRKQLPNWLMDAMDQAEKAARDGKTPVVVLHELGKRYDNALCVLKLCDLVELLSRY